MLIRYKMTVFPFHGGWALAEYENIIDVSDWAEVPQKLVQDYDRVMRNQHHAPHIVAHCTTGEEERVYLLPGKDL